MLKWLDASEASQVGTALADGFVLEHGAPSGDARRRDKGGGAQAELQRFLQKFLQRVDREARPLKLNVFKRAKLANTFKWRLLEKGIERALVEELTRALVLRLTTGRAAPAPSRDAAPAGAPRKHGARSAQALHLEGNAHLQQRDFVQAIACYEELLRFDPRDAAAHNGLGIALARLSRYREAEDHFRRALGIRPGLPEAHFNLGGLMQATGRFSESETPLRRALKLKPAYLDARVALGQTLTLTGRLAEARDCYEKALRVAPRNTQARVGIGQVEGLEGRFDDAEVAYRRALEIEPNASYAWAALAGLRRMTSADAAWVKRAEEIVVDGLFANDEATLRFAIGKYYDDVGDYARAFRSYQRANELQKLRAQPYDGARHRNFIDDLARVYTREALASVAVTAGSDSERPVFVVGMPRSGTSLVEQIIASHPEAYGAGELEFWTAYVHKHEAAVRGAPPEQASRKRLAHDYLRVLAAHSANAARVVDKAPANSDYLGLIHSVFPRARFIYLQRDPADICLSCYFQQLTPALNYTMDLEDLASYYREHARLMAHWRSALPAGTLLEVPYAELVADQEKWTRRVLEFLALPWDARCLEFQNTKRAVTTASVWQVRQKMYRSSVERWRHYEKFIKPLLSLSASA